MAGKLHESYQEHTLTAGFSYETDKLTEDSNSDGLTFSADQTSDPQNGGGNTGYGLASYLLGTAAVGAKRDNRRLDHRSERNWRIFFMDKWKATKPPDAERWLALRFSSVPFVGQS